MARTGVLVLLACIGLCGVLVLRLRSERYSGPVDRVTGEVCFVYIVDPPGLSGYMMVLPNLPKTFPGDLGEFCVMGVKGDSAVYFRLNIPSELRVHAVQDVVVEIRHDFLDLPVLGPVAAKTRVRVGDAEWSRDSWLFWGILAGIASAPGLIWLVIALPMALLDRHSASKGTAAHSP